MFGNVGMDMRPTVTPAVTASYVDHMDSTTQYVNDQQRGYRPLAIAVAETSYPAVLVAGLAVGLGRIPQTIRDLHVKYGKVIRIAPDELSFVDGDAWKPIYGTRPGHGQKPKDVRVFPPTANNVPSIIQSNDADHSRFRRLLSHAFSGNNRGQEPIVRGYIDLLIQRLHENANDENKPVDMVSWYNYTTFDVIGDLAFGEPFGCLEESRYHPWGDTIAGNGFLGAQLLPVYQLAAYHSLSNFTEPDSFIPERFWVTLGSKTTLAYVEMRFYFGAGHHAMVDVIL
ncbi:uncharacterized protein ATNIH1004_001947 [Aspergillus tanneri]|uniref:Uncharacterized protein n=1 Tax=Aspergillus tanneri TaxID=1220188 RepID=A0A5M9M366_9EURO|nr:uncharacterized protein ATNIH1004_001947 [Aspergillus tanneri]KAA8641482.1 hypothetical protein ATNIH1004_001947 [Aspergillus tanneri]